MNVCVCVVSDIIHELIISMISCIYPFGDFRSIVRMPSECYHRNCLRQQFPASNLSFHELLIERTGLHHKLDDSRSLSCALFARSSLFGATVQICSNSRKCGGYRTWQRLKGEVRSIGGSVCGSKITPAIRWLLYSAVASQGLSELSAVPDAAAYCYRYLRQFGFSCIFLSGSALERLLRTHCESLRTQQVRLIFYSTFLNPREPIFWIFFLCIVTLWKSIHLVMCSLHHKQRSTPAIASMEFKQKWFRSCFMRKEGIPSMTQTKWSITGTNTIEMVKTTMSKQRMRLATTRYLSHQYSQQS